jgi:hypothetical protein
MNSSQPAWFAEARPFYSKIEFTRGDPVSVFEPLDDVVTDENPGTLCLRLQPDGPSLKVINAKGATEGIISAEGPIPGIRYVMRRSETIVWTLAVRSLLLKRHSLEQTLGDAWTFDTPFFWWQHLTGRVGAAPALVGHVGPRKRFWLVGIEPARDTNDLRAAVALMHRNWWRR